MELHSRSHPRRASRTAPSRIRPLRDTQAAAWARQEIPGLSEIRPGIWNLGLATTEQRTLYSLASLIEDSRGGLHIVDPGTATDANWERLLNAIVGIGKTVKEVASVIVTHLHPDHIGLADRLRTASGAEVVLHAEEQAAIVAQHDLSRLAAEAAALEQWGVPAELRRQILTLRARPGLDPGFTADRLARHGDLLDIPGRTVRVLHTPGHTVGSICLHEVDSALVFTGDLVVPTLHPGIGLAGLSQTNPLVTYQSSLRQIGTLGVEDAVPGHGYAFASLGDRAADHAAHHRRRTEEASRILAKEPDISVFDLAAQLTWRAGFASLRGWHLRSALLQASMHRSAATFA